MDLNIIVRYEIIEELTLYLIEIKKENDTLRENEKKVDQLLKSLIIK